MRKKNDVKKILAVLDREYPQAACSLDHSGPLELLVATILSAQCTDERVNKVTVGLFRKYKNAADYAQASLPELEADIRSTGFFRNKAKSIKGLGQVLAAEHQGRVPDTLDELIRLPGVGRKTANVVLGTAFDVPGLAVDTHVGRIAQRLGLTQNKDPVKIEYDLMELIPKERWIRFGHQLIAHGRRVCTARRPQCPKCPLLKLCPFGQEQ
ncbi:MAG: endonuclease III [Thermodesulfobacteriota bacterium]|nr:endonuclease III [Thermodesulfobacteriota bacterium]